eukprot:TRINITY_DN3282_c0_g2_i1.p1 TRINITY_DN3282_c0_g2~~TRINITY_DN3282_c0_g2_i1.p1  ORF type:complete len:1659 (+),score=273.96 TRINITY_DN3282_c0_g2_i1:37-4977(+)
MKLLVFALVFCWLNVARSAAPAATSATYQVKSATINGIEYKAAVFNAEFDQDLYVLDNFPCQCGMCSTNVLPSAANENSFNFTDLSYGKWEEGELIGTQSIKYYRLDIDTEQLCHHITIEVEVFHGFASVVVATGRVPSLADYDWYRPVTGRRIFKLCNSHAAYGQGRFYVGVVVNQHNEYNLYKIRYTTAKNPDCAPLTTEPAIPSNYPEGFQWLQDGQATHGFVERESHKYYGFQINTQCTRFAVSLQKNSSGEADLYMSVDNKPLGLFEPIDPRRDWLSNNDGDDVISIHYCHDAPPPFTFFLAVTAFGTTETGFDIIATTQNEFVLWPLSGLALNSPNTHLAHSFRLECDSPDGTANEQFFCEFPSYLDCYQDIFPCCFPFYPLSAVQTPNPLWPWNAGDSSLKAFSEILWDDMDYNQTYQANRVTVALMISQRNEDSISLFTQTTDFGKCRIIWTGQITNGQGEAIREELSFQPADLNCTKSFENLVQSSAEIINEMSLSVDYLELTKAHYMLNFKFLLEDWYGCNEFILGLGNPTSVDVVQTDLQVCLHFPNTPEFNSDPCCTPDLLNDQCCATSDLTFSSTLLKQANESLIASKCSNPKCSIKQLDSLVGIQSAIVDPETGCTAAFRREANSAKYDGYQSFVNTCQYAILGERLQGIKCSADTDCYSGVCNKTTGLCIQGNAELVDCLVSNVETSIARFMFNNWGLKENITSSRLTEEFTNRFTLSNACIGPTGIDYRDHYLYGREEQPCVDECPPSREPRCLDKTCPVPAECDEEQSGFCYRSYRLIRGDASQCLNDKTCNWLDCSQLTDAQCQTACANFIEPEFCGDCSSGSLPCTDTSLNQTSCSEGICDIDGVPLSECLTTGVCDAKCNNLACLNETSCAASGVCSDQVLFADYIAQYGAEGICLKPKGHELNFIATCASEEIDSPFGCGLPQYLNETSCSSAGHTWWTWATDRDSCLSFKTCAESIFGNAFVSWKNEEQCTSCHGEFNTAFTWSNGTWRYGNIRSLVWMPRAYVSLNKLGESFDVIAFRQAVSAAIVSRISLAYTTEAVCRYSGSVNVLNTLLCDCNSNFNSAGDCYDNYATSTLIGVVRACPYITSSVTASPATLRVFADTMSTDSFCKAVQLESTSASFYTSESSIALSSEIYNKRIPNDYAVVNNAHGGIVGQIVSDGVIIHIDLSDGTILANPFELCIDIDQGIGRAPAYSVYGFGQLLANGTVVVITNDATTSPTSVCARVFNGTYFAIARQDGDWQSVQPYDELQSALKWVGLALYFLVVIFGVFQLAFVATNYRSLIRGKQKIAFVAIVLIFNILRGVYFALPVNSFKEFYIVQYLLFELPTFLFFTIYTITLYLWSGVLIKQSVLSKGKARVRVRRIRTVYIIVNAIMYAVFVALVLLNQFLPQSEQECKIGSASNATSARYYIILAYQIFIAAVCFGVSLAFMIQGIQFILIFKKAKMVNTSGSKDKRRQLITFIAITCTALFIGRTIVFLYAAVTGNPVTIIIFVLFEVLPSLALLYYLRPYDWQRPFSTAKKSSGTNGKSSQKSTKLSTKSVGKTDNMTSTSSMGPDESARSPKPPVVIQTVTTPEQIADPDLKPMPSSSEKSASEAGPNPTTTNEEQEEYPRSDTDSSSSQS